MIFLYSFLGILTLQIGVAVLCSLFINIAAFLIITNFLDVPFQSPQYLDTVPVSYILLGVFILLLLLTGSIMFLAAYKQSKQNCLVSVILVALILIIFLISSIISFLNMPSMTKNVCVARDHCPESLWGSSLKYRKISKSEEEDVTTESGVQPTDTVQASASEVTTIKNPSTVKGRVLKKREKETGGSNKNHMTFRGHNDNFYNSENEEDKLMEVEDKSPLGFRVLNRGEENQGILNIMKRSVSSITNNVKVDYSPKKQLHFIQKRSEDENNNEETDEGANEEVNTEYNEEVNTEHNEENQYQETYTDEASAEQAEYIFGYHFFLAVILLLIFTIFFVFTIIVLWSFRSQLNYINIYSIDPASKCYLVEGLHAD